MAAGRSSKNLVGKRRKVGEEEEDDEDIPTEDFQSESSTSEAGEQSQEDAQVVSDPAQGQKSVADDFKTSADTTAMLRGMPITDTIKDTVDFEGKNVKQKKEHEEYKKQRDADPAFIPNRGNFFMHDTRGQYNGGPLPHRGAGRGRGRGMVESQQLVNKKSEHVWKHDLHESINEAANAHDQGGNSSAQLFSHPTQEKAVEKTISFSSTTLLGRVQLRVMLPGMQKAITYAEVPLKKYVRLPDHRPPLRRDKPVRVSLPDVGVNYIFPSTERSFIFIPRQMRPNQRNQRNTGGYGYSSRRTSMYGSIAGSVAASRRSSIARDREGMFSPGSYAGGFQRPVVRLPRGGYGAATPPFVPYDQHLHTYPLPQQPAFQGTPTTTVQHPRPQKAISVSGIESPAALTQRHDQPFHSQLPVDTAAYYSPRGQHAQIASPLSQIPEQAAQYMYPYNTQQPYYYNPMPMYMMPQQFAYPQDQGFTHDAAMLAHESNGMVFYMPATEVAQTATTEQYQPAEGFVPNYAVPGLPPTPAPDQSGYYYPTSQYY